MKFQASTILILLGIISSVVAVTIPKDHTHKDSCPESTVEKLVFHTSLKTFLTKRRAKKPDGCDWDGDGCSSAPEKPNGYNFHDACMRHDFAYHNYKRLNKLSENMRKKVDNNFLKDLLAECATYSIVKQAFCGDLAVMYYGMVRDCGDGDCLGRDIMGAVNGAWDAAKKGWGATKDVIKKGWHKLFG